MEAGQRPEIFDDQTPATYAAILKGAERADLRAYELALFQAWQTERFAREHPRLKPFDKYRQELRPRKPSKRQTPEEMLAAMRAIQKSVGGANAG